VKSDTLSSICSGQYNLSQQLVFHVPVKWEIGIIWWHHLIENLNAMDNGVDRMIQLLGDLYKKYLECQLTKGNLPRKKNSWANWSSWCVCFNHTRGLKKKGSTSARRKSFFSLKLLMLHAYHNDTLDILFWGIIVSD
jgi:hypothetical protein